MVGWLTGYSNRFKLTVDSGDISAALTHFPLRVHLSSSSGINSFDATDIFDEIGANNLKLAVTKDDGTTECYVEIDNWDSSAETADLWVSKSDLVISDSADTVLYLYYDSSVANNTTYVGVTDSVVAENVWDANFKFVCHMSDATTSTVKDSTSNDNDGAKLAANEPIEATGKIGAAQDSDGGDDVTEVTSSASLNASGTELTISFWVKIQADYSATSKVIISKRSDIDATSQYSVMMGYGQYIYLYLWSDATANYIRGNLGSNFQNVWVHVVAIYDNDVGKIYANGVDITDIDNFDGVIHTTASPLQLSGSSAIGSYSDAILDEVEISSVARNTWVGASYETQRDHLITFGVDFGTTGESLYYYRDRFWTHLPKPEPIPQTPDPSTVDWSIGAIEKAKLDRDAEELLGLNKKIRKIREQEWLDNMRDNR